MTKPMRLIFFLFTILFFTSCSKKESVDVKTSILGTWEGVYNLTNGGTNALVQIYKEDGSVNESFNSTPWGGTFTVSGDSVMLKTAYYVGEFYFSTVKLEGNAIKGVRRGKDNTTVIGTYTLYKR